jgi:predicted O-methyltransferase YrrM
MNFTLKKSIEFLGYNLRCSHRNGHGIHSPFLFDFVMYVMYNPGKDGAELADIRRLRKRLSASNEQIVVEDLGAGSARKAGKGRKIKDILRIASTTQKYGRLLHRVVNYLQPEVVIELGTNLGLGAMYMASGNTHARVFTIEGSIALHDKAKDFFLELGYTNIIALHGNFDEVLPVILKENGKFDLMFIDGNHRKEAMLRYFRASLPFVREHSVMIFDDIRWSEDMLEGWREICRDGRVRFSLDLFHWGIVFFDTKMIKQHYEIFY